METLIEKWLFKSRSGIYKDTAENRRLHRVGQHYGSKKQQEPDVMLAEGGVDVPGIPNARKVNLTKYLSEKMAAEALNLCRKYEQLVDVLLKVKGSEINTREKAVDIIVDDAKKAFNDKFNSLSKAERARDLYAIIEMSKRGSSNPFTGELPVKIKVANEKTESNKDDASTKNDASTKRAEPTSKVAQNIKELRAVAKKKKYRVLDRAMTFEEADSGATNPYFALRVDGKDFRINCQTCVFAYELRRRGIELQASGLSGTKLRKGSLRWRIAASPTAGFVGGESLSDANLLVQQWDNNFIYDLATSSDSHNNRMILADRVFKRVREEGDGSRFFFAYVNRSGRSGHVVTLENIDGDIRLYDPQTNLKIDGEENVRQHIDSHCLGRRWAQITRVDDKQLSPDLFSLMAHPAPTLSVEDVHKKYEEYSEERLGIGALVRLIELNWTNKESIENIRTALREITANLHDDKLLIGLGLLYGGYYTNLTLSIFSEFENALVNRGYMVSKDEHAAGRTPDYVTGMLDIYGWERVPNSSVNIYDAERVQKDRELFKDKTIARRSYDDRVRFIYKPEK